MSNNLTCCMWKHLRSANCEHTLRLSEQISIFKFQLDVKRVVEGIWASNLQLIVLNASLHVATSYKLCTFNIKNSNVGFFYSIHSRVLFLVAITRLNKRFFSANRRMYAGHYRALTPASLIMGWTLSPQQIGPSMRACVCVCVHGSAYICVCGGLWAHMH